jgi:lipid-binding SYLF domain-containing protein
MKRALCLLVLAWSGAASAADWQPDPAVPLQVAVADTLREFRAQDPSLERFFDEACAIAVFPRVVRAGLGIGGGSGRGLLLVKGAVHGVVTQSALTLGFQLGRQTFRQLMFFRTCEAMQEFTGSGNLGRVSGRFEFQGRAAGTAGQSGSATDPGFTSEVAIFSLARGGLMVELAAGGVRYRFEPAAPAQ